MRQFKKFILVVALVLFVTSLFFPAYLGPEGGKNVLGFSAFFFGGFSLLGGVFAVGWLANPLALTSVILLRSKQVTVAILAVVFAILSIIVSLSSIYLENTDLFPLGAGIPAGNLGLGFYIWVSSLAALLFATIVNSFERK